MSSTVRLVVAGLLLDAAIGAGVAAADREGPAVGALFAIGIAVGLVSAVADLVESRRGGDLRVGGLFLAPGVVLAAAVARIVAPDVVEVSVGSVLLAGLPGGLAYAVGSGVGLAVAARVRRPSGR